MKQRYLNLFLVFIFFGILFSCQEQPNNSTVNKAQVINEVTTMFDQYHEAIKKQGLTGEINYLDNSPEFYWVPPEFSSALNYDEVRAILTQNAPSLKSVQFSWKSLEIYPLSNSIATYTGIVSGSTVDIAGVAQSMSLIESGTVIKRHDEWKLLCGQTSVLPNKTN